MPNGLSPEESEVLGAGYPENSFVNSINSWNIMQVNEVLFKCNGIPSFNQAPTQRRTLKIKSKPKVRLDHQTYQTPSQRQTSVTKGQAYSPNSNSEGDIENQI